MYPAERDVAETVQERAICYADASRPSQTVLHE